MPSMINYSVSESSQNRCCRSRQAFTGKRTYSASKCKSPCWWCRMLVKTWLCSLSSWNGMWSSNASTHQSKCLTQMAHVQKRQRSRKTMSVVSRGDSDDDSVATLVRTHVDFEHCSQGHFDVESHSFMPLLELSVTHDAHFQHCHRCT